MRQTSLEAYRHIQENGILSKRRWEAYDILFRHGPMTANEVFEQIKLANEIPHYRHSMNPRMADLRNLGFAVEVGTKKCSITGHNVILWDVTSLDTPLKQPKRKTRVHELEEEVERLRQEVHRLEELLTVNGYKKEEQEELFMLQEDPF